MEIIIEPGKVEKNYWKDLWKYKELFYILAWRDIKVRYKQTFIGASWGIIRPLLTMFIFTIIFNKIAKLEGPVNVPYSILVYTALLPWQFFSNALSESSSSLVSNSNLITKVYFPRLVIPFSSVVVSFIDFVISFAVLGILCIYFAFVPSWQIVFLPLFIIVSFLFSFGFGLLFTALNVRYRDFRFIIPFVIQLGLYISPIGFDSGVIPEQYRIWYDLNPMVAVIDGFRWCIVGGSIDLRFSTIISGVIVSVVTVVFGIYYFRKVEKSFADFI